MRSIPDPGFSGDDGGVDPDVLSALAAYGQVQDADEAEARLAALEVLQDSRVLVPVVAVLGEVEYDESGLARDKTSDMASVLMTGKDGRTALLAFTGMTGLARWDAGARPVPVPVRQAAQAAIQDEAVALVIDVAGPVSFVIEDAALLAVARGDRLVRLDDGWGWARAVV